MAFRVVDPGIFSTIQDLGRRGYQRFGLSVSGAADKFAFISGNLLLGNHVNAAAIETTLFGLHMEVLQACDIAVTGADLGFHINGQKASTWAVHRLQPGDVLRFIGGPSGCRAYVCVRGGIDVQQQYGSRSTDPVVGIGGLNGRALQAGDVIPIGESGQGHATVSHACRRRFHPDYIPQYTKHQQIRVILGPQADRFSEETIHTFLSSEYTVTPQSNSMGCHLEGPSLQPLGKADILSECIPEGSIQVPSSGKPIVLLAGRRGIGGYAKIATVITVDIPKVAQARPGDQLRFTAVSVEEAQKLLLEQRRLFQLAKLWGAM